MSINDAAALLIQLDPDDFSELSHLREMLENLANDISYPQACRELILQAVQLISEISESESPELDRTLSELGKLIEEAMAEFEKSETEKVDIEPSQTEPEAQPSDVKEAPVEKPATPKIEEGPVCQSLPEDMDIDLVSAFIAESSDLIFNAEEALLTLETNPDDMDAVGLVFRAFHTVKGTAAFLKLSLVSEIAHHAETLLSRIRDREIHYSGGYADLALRSVDMIKTLIQIVQEALNCGQMQKPDGYDELCAILMNPEEHGIGNEESEEVSYKPRLGDILVSQGKIQREKIEEVASAKDETSRIGERIVKSKAASVTEVAQGLRTQQKIGQKQVAETSVRVSIERLDRLIEMVGELVVSHSMIAQDEKIAMSGNHELYKKVSQTSKIVRELQAMSMSLRMVPLKPTFKKMARLVRDLSHNIGKKVTFVTEGEDTEIDRNMVDYINDPLVHMIRNAIDHGIEAPEERNRIGKPINGTIQLSAYHSAGNVVVEIRDDGKGLDRDAIINKALTQGLLEDDDDRMLSPREVYNLIFEPGFSTAQTVSDVSGRGVGMDVVKRNIETLHGQVEIHSTPGKGSTFKMSFPLTLAIIDGMVIRLCDQKYVIPTSSIVRSIQPELKEVTTVFRRGEMLSIQGKLIPLFRLAELFRVEGAERDPSKSIVVIVEDDGMQAGLMIDELIGSQQIVIKTMGEALGNIAGISGSAIMPNGRVGLILDVGGLVRLANEPDGRRAN